MGKAIVIPLQTGKEKILLAEQTVLGSAIFDSSCLPALEGIITPADFAYPQNEEIFAAVLKVQAEGLPVDLVSVTEHLHRTGKLDAIGGPRFLVDITDNVGSASQAEYYAKVIREASISRKYAELCKANHLEAQEAADGKCRLHEILASHETRLFSISRDYYRSHVTTPIAEMVIEEFRRLEDIATGGADDGVMTGFVDLDKLTNGFKPSELIYLAARPGVGKTALALNIANNCGVPVGFFSLEMSASEIAKRQLSLLSGVDGYLLRSMRLSSSDWAKITSVAATMDGLKIYVDDKAQLPIQELRSKARQLAAKHGAKLIIIDYLQIMKVHRGRSREQEISDISGQLKTMAKELSIPVICLAQLNREVEKRDSKKPKLSDLRESGSLEQDADMVLFLWPDGKDSMAVNFSVAKNRNGRTGEGKLMLNKSTLKFYDWTD